MGEVHGLNAECGSVEGEKSQGGALGHVPWRCDVGDHPAEYAAKGIWVEQVSRQRRYERSVEKGSRFGSYGIIGSCGEGDFGGVIRLGARF